MRSSRPASQAKGQHTSAHSINYHITNVLLGVLIKLDLIPNEAEETDDGHLVPFIPVFQLRKKDSIEIVFTGNTQYLSI